MPRQAAEIMRVRKSVERRKHTRHPVDAGPARHGPGRRPGGRVRPGELSQRISLEVDQERLDRGRADVDADQGGPRQARASCPERPMAFCLAYPL